MKLTVNASLNRIVMYSIARNCSANAYHDEYPFHCMNFWFILYRRKRNAFVPNQQPFSIDWFNSVGAISMSHYNLMWLCPGLLGEAEFRPGALPNRPLWAPVQWSHCLQSGENLCWSLLKLFSYVLLLFLLLSLFLLISSLLMWYDTFNNKSVLDNKELPVVCMRL